MTQRPDPIFPDKLTTAVSIFIDDYKRFKEIFGKKKLYDFFVRHKTARGKDVVLEIRSMRVNEFVDILDEHNIRWKLITEKYK